MQVEEIRLDEMGVEELERLKEAIEKELEKRRARDDGMVWVELETDGWFDRRKHGNAYVAIVKRGEDGKIQREFIEWTDRVWDSKHKYYKARWVFKAPVGAKIEARLTDGSWKNDYKSYFIVKEDGLEEVSREDVLGL